MFNVPGSFSLERHFDCVGINEWEFVFQYRLVFKLLGKEREQTSHCYDGIQVRTIVVASHDATDNVRMLSACA